MKAKLTSGFALELQNLLRERYPLAQVAIDGTKIIAITGTEPGTKTEFEGPENALTFPQMYKLANDIASHWESMDA